jgi:hypothetical protein
MLHSRNLLKQLHKRSPRRMTSLPLSPTLLLLRLLSLKKDKPRMPPRPNRQQLPPRSALFTRATRTERGSRSSRLLVSLLLNPVQVISHQLTSPSLRVKPREKLIVSLTERT